MTDTLDCVLNLYKKKSETPLQTIERYVKAHPEFRRAKMTYAGRLDPMAEGVLVVLSGEKNKEREAYTGLDKDYEFEFVFGIETDTHDVLGKIVSIHGSKLNEESVQGALSKYAGTFVQQYPAYSSKVVDGVPLFDLARKGKIGQVVMPTHEVTVKSLALIGERNVLREAFKKEIFDAIRAVDGDFRQKEILVLWEKYLGEKAPQEFVVYKARVSCGSGFYVRQLVSDIGKDLGIGAVTVSILRTRVGEYGIKDSLR